MLEDKKSTRPDCRAQAAVVMEALTQQLGIHVPSKTRACQCECEQYAVSLTLSKEDGEWFFFKCEGCNWKNNGKAIADWQSTMRAWKLARVFPSQKVSGAGRSSPAAIPAQRTRFQITRDIEAVKARIGQIKTEHGQRLDANWGWQGPKLPEPVIATITKLRGDIKALQTQFDNATQ
jgi:hypothetical protein